MTPAAGLALALALAAHPNSVSRSRVEVDGAAVRVALAVQTRTLVEELALEDGEDGRLDAGELEAALPRIAAHVLEGYRLRAGGGGGPALVGEVVGATSRLDEELLGEAQWIDLELAYEAERPLEDLAVELALFRRSNPAHLDYASVVWNGAAPVHAVLGLGATTWEVETPAERRPVVRRAFLRLGLARALDWRLGALLVVLLLASPADRRALVAPLAVAAAQGLALAQAALGDPPLPRAFPDLAAPLAVAYLAADLWLRPAPRAPWVEGLLFGAVHGLAAAGPARRALLDEPLRGFAVAWLELGAAGATLGVALAVGAALRVLPGRRAAPGAPEAGPSEAGTSEAGGPAAERWLAPRAARLALAAGVGAAGLASFTTHALS